MKLYTEEQVKQMIDRAHDGYDGYYDVMSPFAPIELPSDEDINERSYYDKDNDKLIVNAVEIVRFRDGAKWLRDKLLNQNK